MQNSNTVLLNISRKYIDFVNRIGGGEVFTSETTTFFSDDCRKIFNGRLVAENKNILINDLLKVYENHGGWKHSLLETISSVSGDTVVLNTIIETDRMGTNTAMIILHCNSDHSISEINEVFSPVQGSYDFNTNLCHDSENE